MPKELKPCPFCGGYAIFTYKSKYMVDGTRECKRCRVECSNRVTSCPMNMRTHHHYKKQDAIDAWNTRGG